MRNIFIIISVIITTVLSLSVNAQTASQYVYWEQLSDNVQKETIAKSDKLVQMFYAKKFQPSDDERTSKLLEILISKQEDNNIRALYFCCFNNVLAIADGALSEVMGRRSITLMLNYPKYVLNYLSINKKIFANYVDNIGYELYCDTSYNLSSFKAKFDHLFADDSVQKNNYNKLILALEKKIKELDD